jgi:hypothetical protein
MHREEAKVLQLKLYRAAWQGCKLKNQIEMKWLPYILLIVLAFGLGWFAKPSPEAVIEARTDTVFSSNLVIRRDTVPYYLPTPLICWHTGDTIHVGDTVLPVEQKIYRDSNYTAYVSGYNPNLDSLKVYPKTVTVTNDIVRIPKCPSKKWGLGIQAGYSYPAGSYVGIGISYNLLVW